MDAANAITGRYQCPKCGSTNTWIAERSGHGGMTFEKIACSDCGYNERTHVGTKLEPPKIWRRVLAKIGGRNGR